MAGSNHETDRQISRRESSHDTHAGDLEELLAILLGDPPALPGWSPASWRTALRQPWRNEQTSRLLREPRLGALTSWVASNTSPWRLLGALAAALAAVDEAAGRGDANAGVLARQVERAIRRAGPLGGTPPRQARVTPCPDLDRRPAVAPVPARAESPFPAVAGALLRQAGLDLHADQRLEGRLAVALDVAVSHWLDGAEPGSGLPPFPRETVLHSTRRLTALLGADQDLLYLVYGPQPGRGRPLDVARRRGLAYWAARALQAVHVGEALPVVPPAVIAHWRQELTRLGALPHGGASAAADRSEAPCA